MKLKNYDELSSLELDTLREIGSMGTGNKLDPSRFQIGDIYDTSVCPLCRVMRRELRKRGIPKLKVLYSYLKQIQKLSLT